MKSKEVRRKKISRYFFLALRLIFFIFLVFVVLGFLLISFSPSSWDGQRRFTIILQDDPEFSANHASSIGLFSIEPRENRAVYFNLPSNTLLDVPYGYGQYPVRSVYPLGLLDANHKAGIIVAKAVQSTLGVFIDGYIINKGKESITPQSETDAVAYKKRTFTVLKALTSLPSFLKGNSNLADTNLSLSEQNALFWKIRGLRSDQIKFINLEDSFIITEDKSPDGSTVRSIDRDLFELLVSGAFQDSKVRGENISAEVVNAAGIERLASSMSLIFEHIGANVISITTSKHDQKKACVMILDQKELEKKETVKLFTQLFKCEIKQKTDEELQGDVRIILGSDFIK